VGLPGTIIPTGNAQEPQAEDENGNLYYCVQGGTIPSGGSITLDFANVEAASDSVNGPPYTDPDAQPLRGIPAEELLVKRSELTALIECTGVWFAGGKFGVSWKAVQIRLDSVPSGLRGYGFEEEDGDEVVADEEESAPVKSAPKAAAPAAAAHAAVEEEDEAEESGEEIAPPPMPKKTATVTKKKVVAAVTKK
jgi:hypothetical protein